MSDQMAIRTLQCPTCGDEVSIGVPLGSTILSVTGEPPEESAQASRRKWRTVECDERHRVHVLFEY